jgi:hypothetical protein
MYRRFSSTARSRWEEEREVVVLARLGPDIVRLGSRAGHLGGELGRNAAQLVVVAAGGADQRRVVGVVVELLLVLGEILEQHADVVGDELLVRDLVERRQLLPADRAAAGRHHHGLVPEEHLQGPAQVVDLGQAGLQLVKTLFHRLSSARSRLTLAVSRAILTLRLARIRTTGFSVRGW